MENKETKVQHHEKKEDNLIAKICFISISSVIWGFIVEIIACVIITNWERPCQGEAATVPWKLFVSTVYAIQFLPCVILGIYLHKSRMGKLLSILTVCLTLYLYNSLFIELLRKAWSRGL